jgi:hypothetical protein
MVVPPIPYARWDQVSGNYIDFSFGSHNTAEEMSLAERFDEDYLSTKSHIKEWGRMLVLREIRVSSEYCISAHVIGKRKHRSYLTSPTVACNGCIRTRRLCARLIKMMDGVVKLAFFPLPSGLWGQLDVDPLSKWICSSAVSDGLMMIYLRQDR